MKKGVLVSLLILIAVVALVFFVSQKKTTEETTSTTPAPTNANTTTTTPATKSAANEVVIDNFAFKEKSITVKKGTAVMWTNKDSVAHTVTFDDATLSADSSGMLNEGDTFTYTFNTIGTFAYHCTPHPDMTASVTVTE